MNNGTALITGASSGIGEATARVLAARGYAVVLVGRRRDRLEKLAGELGARFYACDIRSDLKELVNQCGDVNILINNAGLALGTQKVFEAKASDWDQMIDTNIKALFEITRQFLPQLLKLPSAHIINIGSVAGRYVYPGGAVYCATKFAVRAFTEGLRLDLLGSPVRVTNIEPGMVETEFSQVRLGDLEKAREVYEGMTPLKASDIADTILWVLERPQRVCVQELMIYPTDQAAPGQVSRKN